MTTCIISTTTTINTTIMITVVTVMTDKAVRRAYLGAYEKYEDELKRLRITRRYSGNANACR
jgi:hypothetical protein